MNVTKFTRSVPIPAVWAAPRLILSMSAKEYIAASNGSIRRSTSKLRGPENVNNQNPGREKPTHIVRRSSLQSSRLSSEHSNLTSLEKFLVFSLVSELMEVLEDVMVTREEGGNEETSLRHGWTYILSGNCYIGSECQLGSITLPAHQGSIKIKRNGERTLTFWISDNNHRPHPL